eukprot:snap_masked-scaffold_69-processed-gene-0.17-mRNA-1 protein AED:1.00 eAED:1.00 QI:0/0/0/0/1/1/2/0/69
MVFGFAGEQTLSIGDNINLNIPNNSLISLCPRFLILILVILTRSSNRQMVKPNEIIKISTTDASTMRKG